MDHLGGARHADGMGQVTGRDLACIGAQPEERVRDPQPEGPLEGDPRHHDDTGADGQGDDQVGRGRLEGIPRRAPAGTEGTAERGELGTQMIEELLPTGERVLVDIGRVVGLEVGDQWKCVLVLPMVPLRSAWATRAAIWGCPVNRVARSLSALRCSVRPEV